MSIGLTLWLQHYFFNNVHSIAPSPDEIKYLVITAQLKLPWVGHGGVSDLPCLSVKLDVKTVEIRQPAHLEYKFPVGKQLVSNVFGPILSECQNFSEK